MPDKIDPMMFAPFKNRDRNFSPCIEQLFYAMDVNHDGRVSLDEFIAGYRQVLVFRSMDTNGNCEVSLQEAFAGEAKAVKAGGGAKDEFDPDAIARTFLAMDTDGSGTISLAEFVSATSTVGARWAADLWRKSLCVFHGPQQLECRTLPSSSGGDSDWQLCTAAVAGEQDDGNAEEKNTKDACGLRIFFAFVPMEGCVSDEFDKDKGRAKRVYV